MAFRLRLPIPIHHPHNHISSRFFLQLKSAVGIHRGARPNFAPFTSTSTCASTGGRRAMASSASPAEKFEWLVVVPDKPGMLDKRLEVRPTHFKNLQPHVDSGLLKMGGALLTEVPKDDKAESMKFYGSTLVIMASSREEIMEALKKDVYVESGVWDMDNVQMWPFKCAFRKP